MSSFLRAAVVALGVLASGTASAEPVRGAGSTFAAPVIGKWSESYRNFRMDGGDYFSSDFTVDYEPVGSVAGMFRLAQPEMDFAATDAPLSSAELRKRGLAQFPIVIGGVVPVINIPGVAQGQLKLTGAVLADIFLGKIKVWNDPAIKALNERVDLPGTGIAIVYRTDGSGSTLNWTQFLSAHSPEWKSAIGADTLVKWPVGSGEDGSSRLVRKLQDTPGAIGYVEYGQVVRASLKYALIANREGAYVAPATASFQAAASRATWLASEDFSLSLIGAPGVDAWPVTIVTYGLMRENAIDAARQRNAFSFFEVALERSAADATSLGYAPLPEKLVAEIKGYWTSRMRR